MRAIVITEPGGPEVLQIRELPSRVALRELGRRAEFLDGQLERLDELIAPLVTARAPGLLALYGIGPHTAALLLIAAGEEAAALTPSSSPASWTT